MKNISKSTKVTQLLALFQAIAYDLPELLTSYKKKISQPTGAAAPKK